MTAKRNNRSWFRYPLHIHISSLFLVVVLSVCGVQIWLTQNGLHQVLLDANEHLFDRIAKETQANLTIHYQPAFATVEALSQGELARYLDADDRVKVMPEIISMLSSSPYVLSYSIVFPDGDFLMAYQLYGQKMRAALKVRPHTEYIVFNYSSHDERLVSYEFNHVHHLTVTEEREKLHIAPRNQAWYQEAAVDQLSLSNPYYLSLVDKIGTTISKRASNGAVIAADLTLEQVSYVLAESVTRESSFRVLFDGNNRLYAYSNPALVQVQEEVRRSANLHIDDIANPIVKEAVSKISLALKRSIEFEALGERWIGRIEPSPQASGHDLYLLMVVKSSELLGKSQAIAKTSIYASLILLAVALPFVYVIAQRISKPIKRATERAQRIEQFDFKAVNESSSHIKEIHDLSQSLCAMQVTISNFLTLTRNIAKEYDLDKLLELLHVEALASTGASKAYIYLSDSEETLTPHCAMSSSGEALSVDALKSINLNESNLQEFREKFLVEDTTLVYGYQDAAEFIQNIQPGESFLCIPLFDRRGSLLGGFGLALASDQVNALLERKLPYIESLTEYTSVAIETRQILADQKALMQSFIEVMAGAIDTKSPYTGNHCQRVPVLTEMLTKAAVDTDTGEFAQFTLNNEQWQELHLAAWLHDCGKVTTPEYVVDKSTKLETIYNRIHEIRTRFEVLKRDAHIDVLSQALDKPLAAESMQQLEKQWQQLDDDFAFVAETNIGGEFLDDNAIARIHLVAQRQWEQTLDPRLGLSWEERARYDDHPFTAGIKNSVLTDAESQKVPWRASHKNDERFKLKRTQYQNNLGEIYNLSIRRGTLNEEERYIINNHIVETIRMLESLPFPRNMTDVPRIAGGHHEKMDGTGYPLGLKGEDMPVTARVMALADVFEALTSADRPYKSPKTLSESLRIMSFMVKDHHLDGDLFRLFLESGVYRIFAEKFLLPSQIDEVNIADYLVVE
ncbi:phosphohydrolase [Vibrio sp. ZSDZ65]|uniref:Phosphohydrolase n=1 Tax=Vibrio qingdaonensis TaxID=2829491 RepID=A0A9X3CM09_9VIBR|nr:HD domain-containing phosphohydrolase [Vibrio qingdaonensis]MCW8345914.1 phosphohydrolase [Vibrio qingdaonensis]